MVVIPFSKRWKAVACDKGLSGGKRAVGAVAAEKAVEAIATRTFL